MLLTTYRHSFRSPEINYPKSKQSDHDQCVCPIAKYAKKISLDGSCPPIDVSSKANVVDIDCSYLLKPQTTHNACNLDTTERYLGNMRSVYPDLYERIKKMPSAELNRILENDANKTVYTVDYCDIKEYSDGFLENQSKKNVCGEETKPYVSKVDPEEFKCFSAFRPHKPQRNVEQQKESIQRNYLVTEYMDKFSRTGCVILKSNVHVHKKCPSPQACKHPLKYCPIIH